MCLVILCILVAVVPVCPQVISEGCRSTEGHVDPWDRPVTRKSTEKKTHMNAVDLALLQAQKDIRYFKDEPNPWEKPDPGEDYALGFNFTRWNKTYIRPPPGFGEKQTAQLMKSITVPDFDITKIKLKPNKKNNDTMVFAVLLRHGSENKIVGYSSKRLYVQVHAPSYKSAADNELARFLSRMLCIPRGQLTVKQGAGHDIRKVYIPKATIHEKVYIKKLIKEFALEKVTNRYDA